MTAPALDSGIAEYSAIIGLDALQTDQPTRVEVEGRVICVLRTESELIAFEDRCPHRGEPLSNGSCRDGILKCRLHGWEFATDDGMAVSPKAPFGLEMLDLRVSDGTVEVVL
ncbi:MAG: Rieske (2Fe-2S) protein [Solirubrobacterales bacterium]